MIKTIKTVKEAAQEWVSSLNAIPRSLIERAFSNSKEDFKELTTMYEGQRAHVQGTEVTVIGIDSSNITVSYEGTLDDFSYFNNEGELIEIKDTSSLAPGDVIQYSGGDFVLCDLNDVEVLSYDTDTIKVKFELNKYDLDDKEDSWLPMWGFLWMFEEACDNIWARENIDTLSSCGFEVFEDTLEGDMYIGIDGAGYDFYEEHWIPLYKARGLKWHTEE